MSSDATRSLSQTPEQLGRYRLIEQLGQGGMGTVYLALDTKLDRRVAIKVLPAHSVNDAGAVARFQREAKALAKLSHPGIVQAHDADSVEGRHFLVMEHVEGTSLANLLTDKGRLPPAQAADYIHQAALALHHAHEKGLVHRDLKPSNLLLTPQGQVKILDLGLARFLQDQIGDPNVTREGAGLGTPDYAAPEQFRDAHSADVRSDIYSLGCTLYHLLAGQVPFPGSSLAEKCRAHEVKEPAGLEKLCPESPGGLVLAVARMMAKDPADRFQSALEVANALAPFAAAGSAASFQSLKNTSTWQAGQLTLTTLRRRRTNVAKFAVGAGAAVLLLAVGVWLGMYFLTPAQESSDPGLGAVVPETNKDAKIAVKNESAPQAKAGEENKPAPFPKDPDVLTVSQDTKDGGEFRTINEALKQAMPGMTVRVLDDKTYAESMRLTFASQHAGITLEAPRRATLRHPTAKVILMISHVPEVTVRGFHFQAEGENEFIVAVTGQSPGVSLEDLHIEADYGRRITGVALEHLDFPQDKPVVVRACRFGGLSCALQVSGRLDPATPQPCRNAVLRQNTIAECWAGVNLFGAVSRIQVVGNLFLGVKESVVFGTPLDSAHDLLIANNTFLTCARPVTLFADAAKGVPAKNVQVRNNLILDSKGPDMVFMDTGPNPLVQHRGFGDGGLVQAKWKLDHNWREGTPPKDGKGWIPVNARETQQKVIDVLSRDPRQADFLRPAKDSPLAEKGAGLTDPALPAYVGAVPPDGTTPWDWTRTWQAWPPGALLTVSQKPEDRGTYRTINDALAAAKPWATIRVLDKATYREVIVLENPAQHQGLCLEAPKQAAIALGSDVTALAIRNVPDVTVKGFLFQAMNPPKGAVLLSVSGHCPGASLEHLDFQSRDWCTAIDMRDLLIAREERPLLVRGCRIEVGGDGISLLGQAEGVSRGALIRDNHIRKALRGILLQGAVADCHITGNLVTNCSQCGMQIQDPTANSHGILLANNTVYQCFSSLRVWQNPSAERLAPGQASIRNNLMFDSLYADLAFVQQEKSGNAVPGDAPFLYRAWTFDHNRRDRSGNDSLFILPLAAGDKNLVKDELASIVPTNTDFLRPRRSSSLAQGGAGVTDPFLPRYVGALPPRTEEPWDWDRTWNARARTISRGDAKPGDKQAK